VHSEKSIVTLKESGLGYWCLYNSYGNEMCPPQRFDNEVDAVAWGENYISSWHGLILRVEKDVSREQRDPVPK